MSMTLMSPAFEEGARIPQKYSRDGENLLPPLKWSGAPDETKSFALIIEDPDAPQGTFRHLA
ncbi:MAG TPA: YbhB/YbcL family Raf kinase inhibitor-like protein, partial [Devosiaceae bacterium]|nr:YbhB/YbcL family Raf kinase inhibitor-like protein [Devosiaceae bacterium]